MATSKLSNKLVQPQNAVPEAPRAAIVAAEMPRREAVARALFEAFLAVGEAEEPTTARASAALAEAKSRLGLGDGDLLTPEGDVAEVWAGAAVTPELARTARRLLAAGVDVARRDVDEAARAAQDRRIVKAAASSLSVLPLSLPAALEENQSTSFAPLLQAAVAAAVELSGGTAPETVASWLAALCAPADPHAEATRLSLACASLALEPTQGRAERLVALCETARAPALLRFVAAYPELRREPALVASLARSPRASARAAVALVLAELGAFGEPLIRAAVDAPDPKLRATRAAALFSELRAAGGNDAAATVVRVLGAHWPAREPAPLEIVARAGLAAEDHTRFLSLLGESLSARAGAVPLQCHEAALLAALKALEAPDGAARPAVSPAAIRSAVSLCAAGQAPAVAAQLMGSGAALATATAAPVEAGALERGALGAWADFTLAVARAVAAAGAGDPQPFYVTLVSIFARAPERLADFRTAIPVLVPVRARLQAAFGSGQRRAETFERLQRERHLQELAEEVARQDRGSAVLGLASRSEPHAQGASGGGEVAQGGATQPLEPSARHSFSVSLEVVDGVDPSPPTRASELLRVFTGFEFLRRLVAFPARWLGYRSVGRLELYRDALVVEETTRFFGQTLKTRRQEVAPSAVSRVERIERAPSLLLALGLVALVVLTWFGVSVAFDGFAIGDGVLIAGGLGAIAVGLLIDGALYTVFRRARGSTRLCLYLRDRRRPLRVAVARADAERVMGALRALRIG